jgi:radical SAM superfamily enzyme with C-terminal helix-hairpin-helix motif
MITLLDGYIDQPACLGVPPYISPDVRYIAGAIQETGTPYEYVTIDAWRKGKKISGKLLIIVAGAVVPGKYLRGMPISYNEFFRICKEFKGVKIFTGASAKFGFSQGGGKPLLNGSPLVDYVALEDGDAFIFDFLQGNIEQRKRTKKEWKTWSLKGASIVKQHPDFPSPLIAEIETYRGCTRWWIGGCSFCMEPFFGKPVQRDEIDIINEVEVLQKYGVNNFRLGCQSCFFSYKAIGIGTKEVSRPNPIAIKRLLEGISKLKPYVLHIDNVNPAVVAEWQQESKKISELLVKCCTPGNTAALGMESADEMVIKKNNLNATPEQVLTAIKLINEVGHKTGENGMPYFLPGINLLFGLHGERNETYSKNLKFLEKVLKEGYILRRINIRQVVWLDKRKKPINKKLFRHFKVQINNKINIPMIEKVAPLETVLKNVYLELNLGNKTFGRQIGSYPIIICLPYKTKINRYTSVKILRHSYRSITCLEYPLNINTASYDQLKSIPQIGKKRAARLITHRPFINTDKLSTALDDTVTIPELLKWISIT